MAVYRHGNSHAALKVGHLDVTFILQNSCDDGLKGEAQKSSAVDWAFKTCLKQKFYCSATRQEMVQYNTALLMYYALYVTLLLTEFGSFAT